MIRFIFDDNSMFIFRWSKGTFPGASLPSRTRDGNNNTSNIRLRKLAHFLSSNKITRVLAAEHKFFTSGRMFELAYNKHKTYLMYKEFLNDANGSNKTIEESDENNDDTDDNDNDPSKDYKPMSMRFMYKVLDQQAFIQSTAENCCCPTCVESKRLFKDYVPLFIKDWRSLYKTLVRHMTESELETAADLFMDSLDSLQPSQNESFLSDSKFLL